MHHNSQSQYRAFYKNCTKEAAVWYVNTEYLQMSSSVQYVRLNISGTVYTNLREQGIFKLCQEQSMCFGNY